MTAKDLARKLIAIRGRREQIRALENCKAVSFIDVAYEIRDLCYEAWASDPLVTIKAAKAAETLSTVSAVPEIEVIADWIAGIAALTKGKLEKAAQLLLRASNGYLKLGLRQESAQPMIARLIALSMLGEHQEAMRTGTQALGILTEYGDDLAAGKVELNLSNIASRLEKHRSAEAYGLSARKRFADMGEDQWLAMADNGLAITYTELNDFRAAERHYGLALDAAVHSQMTVTVAEVEASLGSLAFQKGNYSDSLKYLELSRRRFEAIDMPIQTAVARLEIADAYFGLNLIDEAIQTYKLVVPLLAKMNLTHEEARGRMNYGRAAYMVGKLSLARTQLNLAGDLYNKLRQRLGKALVLLYRAEVESVDGDLDAALKLARRSKRSLKSAESPRHRLSVLWVEAKLLIRLERIQRAEKCLRELKDEASRLKRPAYSHLVLNALGEIALSKGKFEESRRQFLRAAEIIERMRAPLPGEELKIAFLADRLGPFVNLAKQYIGQKKYAHALMWVERARSRALSDSLSENFRHDPESDDDYIKLRTSLREELNWLYGRMDQTTANDRAKLERESQIRERKIAQLDRRIESLRTAKSSSTRVSSKFTLDSVAEIRRQLGEKQALVEFTELGGDISAFVITSDGIEYFSGLASSEEIAAELENFHFHIQTIRHGAASFAGMEQLLKQRIDVPLHGIYSKIIRPMEAALGNKDLVIVPSGVLNYVPFSGLLGPAGYLIESRQIKLAPSAAVWLKLIETPKLLGDRALLIGFADETIPMVYSEIETIASRLPDTDIRIGEEATFLSFKEASRYAKIIHIACHGNFRSDNPMYSSLQLADGWVTVRDICHQKLNARLVTLSACETGKNLIAQGEEVVGLARGFLSAGAQNLVLSLWSVSDAATAELMSQFYSELQRDMTVSASLQKAQNEMIARGYHPYYWAAFYGIGK